MIENSQHNNIIQNCKKQANQKLKQKDKLNLVHTVSQ